VGNLAKRIATWPAEQRLAAIAWLGLQVTLFFGALVPVYSDEFGWRFQERAWLDGADIGYSDTCGPNTVARPPFFMMPVRAFSAWANAHLASPLFIRLEGMACAVLLVVLLGLLIRRIEANRARAAMLFAIACSLLGMGVLPLMQVMSRPEQPLMIATLLILLVSFPRDPPSVDVQGASLKVTAIILLSIVAQSYHLKGVLYVGVPVIGIIMCARGKQTLPVRLTGLAALMMLTATSAHYWVSRFSCPANPLLSDKLGRENIASVLANHSNLEGISRILIAGVNPFNYVNLTVPSQIPMSNWLPFRTFPVEVTLVFLVILFLVWVGVIVLAIIALGRFVRISHWDALREPRMWLAVTLIFTIEVWNVSQINRNTYEIMHIIPAMIITFLLALSLPGSGSIKWPRLPIPLVSTTVGVALVSEVVIILCISPMLWPAFGKGGYPVGQPFSIAVGNYTETRADIAHAMRNAGFTQGQRLHRPLVDELTYMALQGSYKPLFHLGVLNVRKVGLNVDISDPEAYLRSRNSDGVIMACQNLPGTLRSKAAQVGEVCAIAKAQLGEPPD